MESEPLTSTTRQALRAATLSGVRWVGAGGLFQQLTQLLVGVLLMRILPPADFGLLGMVLVFAGFILLFGDLGLGQALIQRETISREQVSTVFWLSLIMGAGAGALTFISAGPIAAFYDEPRLVAITRLSALPVLLSSLQIVPKAMLAREMRFRSLMIAETSAIAVSGAIAVVMAAYGFGVFSLLAQMIAAPALNVLFCWAVLGWRPLFSMSLSSVRDLMSFGLNLVGSTVFNYVVRNTDNLLIGRFLGAAELGIYTRAYGLMLLPLNQITSVLGRVFFPALSRLQSDVTAFRMAYLRVNRAIALLAVPAAVGLFVVAEPFMLVIFGETWAPAAPVLQVLCFVAVKQPMNSTTGWIFQARGRTDLMLRWTLMAGIVIVSFFLIGLRWGVLGVASAYAVATYVLWYPAIAIPGRLIGLSFSEFLRNIGSILGCSLLMGGLVWILKRTFENVSPPLLLILLVFAGVVLYGSLLRLFRVRALNETVDLLEEQWTDFFGNSREEELTSND